MELRAGLVGAAGPRVMRSLLVLMFGWVSCAGVINATRQWLFIWDYYINVRARGPIAGTFVGGTRMPQGGWAAVRTADWVALGGWATLGVAGVVGLVAAVVIRRAGLKAQKRMVGLVVACFMLYWGYHGIMFAFEIIERI